jgi:putative AbiEii toxin of type IV toxin-antitoxin system
MIESITLRNFRGHVATTVPCAPFTLLVGENASGKTSVLRALHYASEGLVPALPGSWAHRGADEMQVTLTGAGREGPFQLEATYERPPRSDGELRYVHGDVRNADGSIGLRPQALWLTLRAEELAAPSSPKSERPELDAYGRGLASALAHLKLVDTERLQRIVDRLRSIVPIVKGVGFSRSVASETVPRLIRVENSAVELQEKVTAVRDVLLFDFVDATKVPAESASEGTLLVLGILTALETLERDERHARRDGGVAVKGAVDVVLIDDIDRALHPRAQRSLVEALRKILGQTPGLQIFATSHSPYLVDALRPEEVVVLGRNQAGAIAAKRLSDFPDERLQRLLSTGELWLSEGDDWVTR